MQSFIEDVVEDVLAKNRDTNQIIFVLPSKRAGIFLKKIVSKKTKGPLIAPEIYSIEEFVERISGIATASTTTQLFELYNAYLSVGDYEKEPFDSYIKWGQILLQDFNEIDRYLVNATSLYQNVAAIQEVNHWSLHPERSELIENYLHFWKHLEEIYTVFNTHLLKQGLGHQGAVYKIALARLPEYMTGNRKKHIFLGFNALNTAESTLIQTLLEQTESDIYWDIDPIS